MNVCKSQGLINDGSLWVVGSGIKLCIVGGSNGNCKLQSNTTNHARIDLDGTLELQGNFTNNISTGDAFINREAIGSGNGTVVFNGTTNQVVNGSSKTIFEKIELNNSNNVNFNLNTDVETTVTFTSGKAIMNGAYLFTVLNTATGAITGYDTGDYIVGDLKRMTSVGSYDYCNGSNDYIELININITSLGSATFLEAEFIPGSPGSIPLGLEVDGTPVVEFLDYGYWVLTTDNETGLVFDVTMTSRGHTNGASVATQHALFRKIGAGNWSNFGTHNNATQSGTTTNPITAKRTGANQVGSFAIAKSQSNALPVELISFNYSCAADSVEFIWTTASELNSNKFCLQTSIDLTNWYDVKCIAAAGNSNSLKTYTLKIKNSEYKYIKLKEFDFDGNTDDLIVQVYDCKETPLEGFKVYPNPANQDVTIELINSIQQLSEVKIINQFGEIVSNNKVDDNINVFKINIEQLAPSIYYICLVGKDDKIFFKQIISKI